MDALTADEVVAARAVAGRVAGGSGGVQHVPIRHHSPACALHLARALAELRPAAIVLELPADLARHLPALAEAATRPPVALVAFTGEQAASYWPLSATSPEWVAIRWAAAAGVPVHACDLPTGDRTAFGGERERGVPVPLGDERALAHSAWVEALVRRTGCRDFNECWDRLFEARAAEPDWRAFFGDVAAYCALARASVPVAALEADGTLPREIRMRAVLAGVTARPVVVVTGGFHTPALLDPAAAAPPAPDAAPPRSYLVRFSHPRLDRLGGYGAGMPSPLWYERLHAATASGAAEPHAAAVGEALHSFAARMRAERPGLAPGIPALVAARRMAAGLATLRGLPGPGRAELLDAARSCFVADAEPRFGVPVLDELAADLTGWGIGNVPPGAGSPPLVEAARRVAGTLGFSIGDTLRRTRDLDMRRRPRHRTASRFLHALRLLDAGFARMVRGPDWTVGAFPGAMAEVWEYAWSPLVEAALIEAALDGDTVERAALNRLRRTAETADRRDALAACRLVVEAAQAGLHDALAELIPGAEAALVADPDLPRVARALGELVLLWGARPVLGLAGRPELGRALRACYRRACALAAAAGDTAAERVREVAGALAAVRDVLAAGTAQGDGAPDLDPAPFAEAVAALALGTDRLPPLLAGAVAALRIEGGVRDDARLAALVAGALLGPATDPADRVAPLAGVMLAAPELLRRSAPLMAALDDALGALAEDLFLPVLPHLRHAFAPLGPREAAGVAAVAAARHGLGPAAVPLLGPAGATAAEMAENLALSRRLATDWAAAGLGHWLAERAA